MRNISVLQIIILVFISVLIITDFSKIKKKALNFVKNLNEKNRKKGI